MDARIFDLKHAIVMGRHWDVSKLVGLGVDVNAKVDHGYPDTPLLVIAAGEGRAEICKLLLKAGASLEARDVKGRTALHAAAVANQPSCCAFLIEQGASIEAKSNIGFTPLFGAIGGGAGAAFDFLLERGADVDARSQLDVTPLHEAVREGNIEFCRKLIERGAPVQVEARIDRDQIAHPLARLTPLHLAVERCSLDLCELLVSHGASPSHRPKRNLDLEYLSPVQFAISERVESISRYFLLDCTVDLSQRTFGYLKRTLTELAEGNQVILEMLRSSETQQSIRGAIDVSRSDASMASKPSTGMSPL